MKESIERRICVSIYEASVPAVLREMQGLEFAEIRLDGMKIDFKDIVRIFSKQMRLVATFRPGKVQGKIRLKTLIAAIDAGASFVDVEFESDTTYKEKIMSRAHEKGCKVIVSYHNNEETPSREELERVVKSSFESGGDIVKVACMVNKVEENARLLGLLGEYRNLIVIGMGKKGNITRVASTLLGSPFTFASSSPGKETASGQIDVRRLIRLVGSLT